MFKLYHPENKFTFFALLLYVFWVIGFAYFSFTQEKKHLYAVIDQQLLDAAHITPLLLPEGLHGKKISESDLTKESHLANIAKLSKFTDTHDIVYIYTLILREHKIRFTSSSATEQERESGEGLSLFFDHYDDADPLVYKVFENNETAFLEYTDQWGTFRSVFIPLQAEDGSYFVTGADIAIDQIKAILKQHFYQTLMISFLFLLFVYPIYLAATYRVKQIAAGLKHKVKQQTAELLQNEERLNLAMIVSNQAWFDLNLQTGDIVVSDEYPRILGFTPSEFHSNLQEWQQNIHPEDKYSVLKAFQQCLETGQSKSMEYRRLAKSGKWIWLNSIGEVVDRDEKQRPLRMIGIHQDISKRKMMELRDNYRSVVLEQLVQGVQLSVILQSIVQTIEHDDSSVLCSILLLDDKAKHLLAGAAPSLPAFYNEAIDGLEIGDNTGSCGTAAFLRKRVVVEDIQTHPYWVAYKDLAAKANLGSCWSEPIMGSNDSLLGTFAIYHHQAKQPDEQDIKLIEFAAQLATVAIERFKADEKLRLSARVFKDAHEGITITDANSLIVDVNPTFCEITGYSREEVIGKNPNILNSGKQTPEFYADMWNVIAEQGYWHGEVWNRKKQGELYAEQLTISSILDDQGKAQNYIGLFSDITQTKNQQQTLELMAHYDVLTGLPNRTLLVDRYTQAIAHSKRAKTLVAVCFLDLDNFKPVNDNYGHLVGDQLLIEVAERIKSCVREEDTVSRMGGDEFVLLLGSIDGLFQCEILLERLHDALAKPYSIEGNSITISASSGFTLYPSDAADLDTLIRHADQAMYQAKLTGRSCFQLFNADQDQQVIAQQHRLKEIQSALLNDEMCLYYQPKVNMKTGEAFGVEALIRWQHPEKGLIPPLDFLPIISDTELEVQLGSWVIESALKQLDLWQDQGIVLEVSVNISSYHLQSAGFIAELDAALARHPSIDSKHLQLEILESSALGDLNTISAIIKTCHHALGTHIALDDFGTGYSSLTHLRNLQASTLKIDQSFVRDVLDDPEDYAIIEGVIGLANAFNRQLIAEGVETSAHGLILLIMGCDLAQGYGISRPMPAAEFPSWLNNYSPNKEWIVYASKTYTEQQKKIMLLELTTARWLEKFENKMLAVKDSSASWPIIDAKKCHYGAWVKQIKQEQGVDSKWLDKVDQTHLSMHIFANVLKEQYQQEETVTAQQGLSELGKMIEEMSEFFRQYEQGIEKGFESF